MYTDSNNKFVSNLFDLVEYVYYGSNIYEGDKKLLNYKIDRLYERCKGIVYDIRDLNNTLSWDDMWQFAEFIKTMEKVYFYHNVQKPGMVCVDKFSDTIRDLFFDYTDKKLYIKITIEAAVEHDTGMHKRLKICAYRDYGAKEVTTFNVNNGETTINNDSDTMLIHTINAYVQKSIADLFECYVELAYHRAIYDTIVGPEND